MRLSRVSDIPSLCVASNAITNGSSAPSVTSGVLPNRPETLESLISPLVLATACINDIPTLDTVKLETPLT